MTRSLTELREEIAVKQKEMHGIWAEAGDDLDFNRVTSLNGDTEQKVGYMRRLNEDLAELGRQRDQLAWAEEVFAKNRLEMERDSEPAGRMYHAGNGRGGETAGPGVAATRDLMQKGLRGMLADHKGLREYRKNPTGTLVIELPFVDYKTLIQVSAATPQAARQDPVNMALEERTVSDLMGQSGMASRQIDYYEETTFNPMDATTVGEGATKPETTIAWTLRTETAVKIAVNVPATKESLDDIAWMEGQIRNRLAFGVRRREEQQILSGDATGTNLRGILNRVGIQTQAKGTDTGPMAIYKAMQLVRGSAGLGFAEPTGVVIHPSNWTTIKLDRTTDGIYLWGPPMEEGVDRIWGLPVRQTTGITAGTALVGAFRPHAEVLRRENVTVTMSTEHGTYFTENKVLVQAESRLALAVYRPSAFATVTGLL